MLTQTREAIGSGARLVERALFGVAFLALGYVAWTELDRFAFQHQALARLAPVEKGAAALPTREGAAEAAKPAPSAVIGRLSIPAASVDAIVSEGVDEKTLRRAIGHIPNTALPGQPGNVGLAAHRDTFFRGLKDLQLADPIQLITTNGTFEYVVEELRIVEPTETGVLAPGPEPTLTLVTCYPFDYIGSAPQRYIVRARGVAQPAARRPVAAVDPDRL